MAAAALVGPAQVAARLVEFGALWWVHPLVSARIATALHPLGAGILAAFGAPAIMGFALLHGAGNGLLTIAKGTLPLAIFGLVGYAAKADAGIYPDRCSSVLRGGDGEDTRSEIGKIPLYDEADDYGEA